MERLRYIGKLKRIAGFSFEMAEVQHEHLHGASGKYAPRQAVGPMPPKPDVEGGVLSQAG